MYFVHNIKIQMYKWKQVKFHFVHVRLKRNNTWSSTDDLYNKQ